MADKLTPGSYFNQPKSVAPPPSAFPVETSAPAPPPPPGSYFNQPKSVAPQPSSAPPPKSSAPAPPGSYFNQPKSVAPQQSSAPAPPPPPGSYFNQPKSVAPQPSAAPVPSAAQAPVSYFNKPMTVPPAAAPTSTLSTNTAVPPPAGLKSMAPQTVVGPDGGIPTFDAIQEDKGKAISAEELERLQKAGSLPMAVNLAMMPTIHKVKNGQEEMIIVMVDAPPCGCRKVNGKKERCRLHRRIKRNKRKTKKKGPVKDDGSDRMKLGALRHAEDSGEERETPINGAITPDEICIVGPAGVGVLIPIDITGNPLAGPRAPKVFQPMRGILVKGPQDCPQFIPDAYIEKNEKGEPKFAAFQRGTLVKGLNGAVFYPDGGNKWDTLGRPIHISSPGIDPLLQATIGTELIYAGTVDVVKNGMPEFRLVDEQHPAPQDIHATLGNIVKLNGQCVFVQAKGQTVGSGDATPCVPTTLEGAVPAGTVLGECIIKDNKLVVVPPGQAGGAAVVGKVIQGDYNQSVLLPLYGGVIDNGVHKVDKSMMTPLYGGVEGSSTMAEWRGVVGKDEDLQKTAMPYVENANLMAQAAILGKNPADVKRELDAARASHPGSNDVMSYAFAAGPYNPNRSVFCYTAGNNNNNGQPAGPYNSNGGGADAQSQFCNQNLGGTRSVFMSGNQNQNPQPYVPGATPGTPTGGGASAQSQFCGPNMGGNRSVFMNGNQNQNPQPYVPGAPAATSSMGGGAGAQSQFCGPNIGGNRSVFMNGNQNQNPQPYVPGAPAATSSMGGGAGAQSQFCGPNMGGPRSVLMNGNQNPQPYAPGTPAATSSIGGGASTQSQFCNQNLGGTRSVLAAGNQNPQPYVPGATPGTPMGGGASTQSQFCNQNLGGTRSVLAAGNQNPQPVVPGTPAATSSMGGGADAQSQFCNQFNSNPANRSVFAKKP